MGVFKHYKAIVGTRISDEDWEQIKPAIAKENRHNILVVSFAFALMMALTPLASQFSLRIRNARNLYLVALCASLVIHWLTSRVQPDNVRAIAVLTYMMISLLLIYATVLGTVFAAGQVATAFPAFVLASPLLFSDRRRHIIICILIHTVFFVCMAAAFDDANLFADDIINSCVFSAISIAINSYMLTVKFSQEYSQLRLAELSSKDMLTNVKNRNSYEQALKDAPKSCDQSLICVFADLNGLHELNEVSGHAVGDAMLKCVGSTLRDVFGDDDTYRIGGDEFVVFVHDMDESEVKSRVEIARRKTEEESCHVSFGVAQAQMPDIDITDLVKRAERQMYSDKRRYYEREGIDRRGRLD